MFCSSLQKLVCKMERSTHLPKLMPLWHDQSAHGSSGQRFLDVNLPDYGGIGVDISTKEKQSIVKHAVDIVHFQAQMCSLPFLPANEVPMGSDPCLSSLHTTRENIRKFCSKLETLRNQIKLKRCEKHRNKILSTYKVIQNMYISGKYEKVLLPEILIELATIFPKSMDFSTINLDYSENLASCNKSMKNPILLYPTGKKLNKLAVTTLECGSDTYKTFHTVDSQNNVVKLGSECIQRIKCAIDGYCYVLQDKVIQFVDFNDFSNISHFKCLSQINVVNFGASQYSPVELISINEKGMVEMFNIHKKKPLWSVKDSECFEELKITAPQSCLFGSHPKSVLCLTNQKLHSFDARSREHKGNVIFSSYHPTCYKNELLSCMKGLLINPFQYFVASSHHLFLCDERYTSKPVLLWNHLLKDSPLYCDVTTFNVSSDSSDCNVLLGTQKFQELVCISVNSKHSTIEPAVSLGPPLLLSSPSDCANTLKFHCEDVDETILKRMSCPLFGVTSIPHNNKTGFTSFQITSPGDIFYQDFEKNLSRNCQNVERTYRVNVGCILTPPHKIRPHFSNWNKHYVKNQVEVDDAYNVSRIHADLKNFLCKQSEISAECTVCAYYKMSHNRDIIASDSCPTCGLENSTSEHLIKTSEQTSLLVGPTTELDLSQFDTTSFFQFTDPYSQKILQAWSRSDEENHVNTDLQSQEYSFNDVSETTTPVSIHNNIPVKNLLSSFQDVSTISSQLPSQNSVSLMDETMADMSFYSQETMEEFIPPSQETRTVIGEMLRTPKIVKPKLVKKRAGF